MNGTQFDRRQVIVGIGAALMMSGANDAAAEGHDIDSLDLLGIADLLKDGPRPSAEIAEATGAHAPSMTLARPYPFFLTPPGSMIPRVTVFGEPDPVAVSGRGNLERDDPA